MAIKAASLVAEFIGDASKYDRTAAQVDRSLRQFATRNPSVALGLNDAGFRSELDSATAVLTGIPDESVMVLADTSTVFPEIQGVEAALAGLGDETVQMAVDTVGATAEIQGVEAALAGIEDESVRVTVDTGAANAELSGLSGTLDGLGGASTAANAQMGLLAGGLAGAKGAASGLLGIGLGAGLYSSANAAGDLAESVNVVGLNFGETKDEMLAFTSDAPRTLGMSTRAANEMGAGVAGLLSNMGFARDETLDWSKDLLTLGADMGSAFNKEPAVAVEAIGSALRGETEPIRAFNVMLSQAKIESQAMAMGIWDGTAALTDHQKAQATLALIMGQTNVVQGDFANTAGGLANTQRTLAGETENLSAAFGEDMAPALASVLGYVTDGIRLFGDLPGPVQTGVLALLGIGAVVPMVSKVADGVGNLTTKLDAGGPAAQRFSSGLGTIARSAGYAAVLYGIGDAVGNLVDKLNTSGKPAAEFEAGLLDAAESGRGVSDVARLLGTDVDGLREKFRGASSGIGESIAIFGGVGLLARREAIPAIEELDQRLVSLASSGQAGQEAAAALFGQISDAVGVGTATEALDGYQGALAAVDNQQRLAGTSAGDLPGPVADAGAAMGDTAAEATAMAEAFDKAVASMSSLHDEMTAGITTEISYQAAVDTLSASIAENGRTLDVNTEEGRANLEAALGLGNQIVTLGQQYLNEGLSVADATAKTYGNVEALRSQLLQAGYTEAAVDSLIATMGLTPENINTLFSTPGLAPARDSEIPSLLGQLDRIPPGKTITIDANTQPARDAIAIFGRNLPVLTMRVQADVSGVVANQFPRREHGGPVRAGNAYIVGEKRAEVFVAPSDGMILPKVSAIGPAPSFAPSTASNSGGGGGGDTYVIHVAGSVVTERDLETTMRRIATGRNQRSGR